jgi:hypothetical protein
LTRRKRLQVEVDAAVLVGVLVEIGGLRPLIRLSALGLDALGLNALGLNSMSLYTNRAKSYKLIT